jgi:hypothetical protein
MAKIILDDVKGLGSLTKINANFDRIKSALQNAVFWRNNPPGEPNSMVGDVDMNNNRIYNLPPPASATEPARLQDVINATTVAGVTSWNNRTGIVSMESTDVLNALGYVPANKVSPVFSGTPRAATPLLFDNSTQLATTEYVTSKIASTTAGVSTVNGRSGAVTLIGSDITSSLGYTPANIDSAALTGTPTAPTQATSDSSTKLATTAFVAAKIGSAGVTSFKGNSVDTPRTGVITLLGDDVNKALGSNASNNIYWNSSVPGCVDATANKSLYIQRNATYSPGSAGDTGGVTGAIYVQSFTPPNTHNNYEWGITSEMFSRSIYHPDVITPSNGSAPQNVAVNGTIWNQGTAPCWGGNFNSAHQYGVWNTDSGPAIGVEVNCSGLGYDSSGLSLGVHVAGQTCPPMAWAASKPYGKYRTVAPTSANGLAYVNNGSAGTSGTTQPTWPTTVGATVSDGSIVWTCMAQTTSLYAGVLVSGTPGVSDWQYGVRVLSTGGSVSSFYSEAIGTFGMRLAGQYNVGIDTTTAALSSGVALRMASGQAISFDQTGVNKIKLNAAAGLLEFYSGSTRRGYINMGSGADVDLASGGGGGSGVSAFNSRTGSVSLLSSDVTGALGFTPASSVSVVDLTTTQTIGGNKGFSNSVSFGGGFVANAPVSFNSSLSIAASQTVGWNSSGNVTFSATGGASTVPTLAALFLRIIIDGTSYKIPVYNA